MHTDLGARGQRSNVGRRWGAGGEDGAARVLFLHPSDELYGADRVLLNLLTGLDRSRFEPLVVLANDLPYEGALSGELLARGIDVRSLPLAVARRKYLTPTGVGGFASSLLHSVRMLGRLIEAERIDLVYSNTLAVWSGAIAAARTRRPHIWHVHELITHPAALGIFIRWFVPLYAQRVVCVSQAAHDHLLRSPAARAKGIILPNGVAATQWIEATGRERVRAELGCGTDDILVGMIGRISTLKAPDLLVVAANDLLARGLPIRCLIAGDVVPGQRSVLDDLKRQIAASVAPDRFSLLGFRRDVPDITAAIDLLVVPSREPESFSLVSVQAMLAGKPVVAADSGALRETLGEGETGLLVPPDDAEALARAIETLARDEQRRIVMGKAGRERALARFDLQRQAHDFNGIIEDVLARDAWARATPGRLANGGGGA